MREGSANGHAPDAVRQAGPAAAGRPQEADDEQGAGAAGSDAAPGEAARGEAARGAASAVGAEAEHPGGAIAAARREEPEQDDEVEALRGRAFAVGWRGYDRDAVDAYVAAVERCIERFEQSRSPTAAVRHALDRVGERTAAILREAEQAAEEMTTSSRAQADDRLQRAEREAAELEAEAAARVRRLDADVERLWDERQRLIDATNGLAARLRAVAEEAEARFPPDEGGTGGGRRAASAAGDDALDPLD